DTETSEGSTFIAGILDLKIRDQPGPWQDGVSATWTLTDMKPGDETALGEVDLHIVSASIPADHLEITCDYTVSGSTPEFADEMAKEMIITLMRYYKGAQQVDLLTADGYDKEYDVAGGETGPEVDDFDGDGELSLYDLKYSQGGNGVDDLLPPYGVWHFEMKIKFDEEAGNLFQGKTLDVTMMFTLNQEASQ
ncbi:MAG: hypothetical protein KAT75_01730, partial [Dehalococcoidia bacterium]|nr:hypothetical protein [Dehalococcoidia bacterium]